MSPLHSVRPYSTRHISHNLGNPNAGLRFRCDGPARAPDLRESPWSRELRGCMPTRLIRPPSIRFLSVTPQVSLPASSTESLTILTLWFTRVVATNSPEDLHSPSRMPMPGTHAERPAGEAGRGHGTPSLSVSYGNVASTLNFESIVMCVYAAIAGFWAYEGSRAT
jgi:hypothetical protein